MKKIYCALALSLFLISCGESKISPQKSTPQNEPIQHEVTNTGDWKINNYVDEFNEKTDKKYIALGPIRGALSNSMTTNSTLDAVIVANAEHIEIQLFEYGGNLRAKLEGKVTFKLRESNGDTHNVKTYDGYTYRNRVDVSDSLFRAILSRGNEIKFSATYSQYGNKTSYSFTIPNADHFQDALVEMTKE